MRVVLDTNVWVSAFLNPLGGPGRLLELAASGRLHAVTTAHLWGELGRVVSEAKIRSLLEAHGTWEFVHQLVDQPPGIECVDSETPSARWVVDDPDDDWVVQAAVTARADLIVSGDQHLLQLGAAKGIRIVSPRDALPLLAE